MTPYQLRRKIRSNDFSSHTSGLCPGYTQANIIIMPYQYAEDFKEFCRLNAKACPVLAMTEPGSFQFPTLGLDIDIRTDVPLYNIYREGELSSQQTDITELWQNDWVAFAIGCSHSFEDELIANGLKLRHIERDHGVSAYVSGVKNIPYGPFSGNLVVSMRPFNAQDAIKAIEITGLVPEVHGSPIHIGDPSLIGIDDLNNPQWGQAVEVNENEFPLFWACGVTPQEALKKSGIPLYIGHAPCHMLVTDLSLKEVQKMLGNSL